MPSASANGISIEYETSGDPSLPPLLLIMGLGAQMIAWDDDFVKQLVDRGFYVVRYDNRDVGLSTSFDQAGVPDIASAVAGGGVPEPAYSLADMADDAAGLLDALEIGAAHVVGVSMGGMIAQSLVINHPDRVLSLVSIMSTTGNPAVGAPRPDVVEALFLTPPPVDRAGAMDGALVAWEKIGSPGFPRHEERIRANAAAAFDRAFNPAGGARQVAAIVTSPDRTPDLRKVTRPTLVIHGESDSLVDPSGGRATAEAVPGAELWMVPGMGHDLPPEMFAEIADRLARFCLGGG